MSWSDGYSSSDDEDDTDSNDFSSSADSPEDVSYGTEYFRRLAPLDCPRSHCLSDGSHCRSDGCQKQLQSRRDLLTVRLRNLRGVRKGKLDELRALTTQVASVGNFSTLGLKAVDVDKSDLCEFVSKDCLTCQVQGDERDCVAARKKTALYQHRMESLEMIKSLFVSDKAQSNTDKAKIREDLVSMKAAIEGLEEQVGLLRLDDGLDPRPSGQRFRDMVNHDEEDDTCSCTSCLPINASVKAALEEGRTYKQQLTQVLGFDGSGKSTLELERERTREAVQRNSPFASTGTYRGFGASATKLKSGSSSNTQPKKTPKKSKRPALGR